jgi:hypothetical protein
LDEQATNNLCSPTPQGFIKSLELINRLLYPDGRTINPQDGPVK